MQGKTFFNLCSSVVVLLLIKTLFYSLKGKNILVYFKNTVSFTVWLQGLISAYSNKEQTTINTIYLLRNECGIEFGMWFS